MKLQDYLLICLKDQYKYQILTSLVLVQDKAHINYNLKAALIKLILVLLQSTTPVSYTHLDVYKRQLFPTAHMKLYLRACVYKSSMLSYIFQIKVFFN